MKMTRGTIGIIACPQLEDELVYSLEKDPEEKNVYVIETGNHLTFCHKMDQRSLPYTTLDEFSLNTGLALDADAFNIVVILNTLGLHKEPEHLRSTVTEQLKFLDDRFDVIALYYGICGNAGWDIPGWAKENLHTPLAAFVDGEGKMCDDCVSVAVGGHEAYRKLVLDYTGMLFLTPATATNWDEHSFSDSGEEWKGFYASRDDYMRDLFKWGGYKYALNVDTGLGDRERIKECQKDIADRMRLELIDPHEKVTSTEMADKIYAEAKSLLIRPTS